jgi:16S rRNA (cytidine1402-2'-O)-methyltransferase
VAPPAFALQSRYRTKTNGWVAWARVYYNPHNHKRAQGMAVKESVKGKTSPDYSHFARKVCEASRDMASCKPEAGLYVVATPIGNSGDISLRALYTLTSADAIFCEDTRVSGALFKRYGIKKPLISCHEHNEDERQSEITARIEKGAVIALVSDAGLPLIADPGFRLVRACREKELPVLVIPGANAALTALAGAGLPTDQFHFGGFLPPKTVARKKAIKALAQIPGTLVFYEAPSRLAETLSDLAEILGGSRRAAVARELTKLFEETKRGALDTLAAFYHAQKIRGEIVILVGPAEEKPLELNDIDTILKKNLRLLSLRDAVQATSTTTGVKKSAIYARALKLSGKNK